MDLYVIKELIGMAIKEYMQYLILICGVIISIFAVKKSRLKTIKKFLIFDINDVREKKNTFTRNEILERIIIQKIQNNDPNFDPIDFCNWAIDIFKDLAINYSKQDLAPMQVYLTPSYYDELSSKIANNKAMQIQHCITDHEVYYSCINSQTVEKGIEYIEVVIGALVSEYKEDNVSHTVFFGSKDEKFRDTYHLKFGRKAGSKTNKNTNIFECPNCGGKVRKYTNICPFCKSNIIENGETWILNNVEKY